VDSALQRELEYYEKLYAGFAQQHFAKPAVVAFRKHLVKRIVGLTGANKSSQVLSLGSGTGDTELLLARHVGTITGVDISPRGVEHASAAAQAEGVMNATFSLCDVDDARLGRGSFDIIIAVFFLHHLADRVDQDLPRRIYELLKPGGIFYALDPSYYRLSGAVGKLLFPALMRRYQTADEVQLRPPSTWNAFSRAGFEVGRSFYDFASTPLAGLIPSWKTGYVAARYLDNILIRLPLVRLVSSNFEIVAQKPS
jgi:SAM-dependent methyltransferase